MRLTCAYTKPFSLIKKEKNKVITKSKYLLLIIMISLLGCQTGNYFPNVCKVEVFGDSLRIETECYGDSIIKHYIDLKGYYDDGFDNSFNATILRKEKPTPNFDCKDDFKFAFKEFDIRFCKEELKLKMARESWTKNIADSIGVNSQIDSIVGINNNFILIGYIDQIDYQIIQRATKDTINTVLKGNYTTEFSGGIQYEIVNSKKDTIELFQRNSWMR